ncbi:MAG: GntR family transcriptional regulator [Clostridia bacterium]|nr:GntR family transcriptional regulator [Clostridia bacterium]
MHKDSNQTKYSMLISYLKEEILLGRIKPGEQIPSENTLAKKLSLSRHTVRKAISMLANEGYVYTEHGRGTYCADRNKTRVETKNIGVITTYISEYIFPRVVQGIDRVLSENGYSIILKNTGNNTEKESAYLEEMLEKNIDGLIIEPTKSAMYTNNLKYYEALENHGIPYVFIHGYYQKMEDKPQVILDDEAGMYSVASYLTELGHREIIGIFKADDIQGINRHKGYARALARIGIPYNPDNVIWFYTEDRAVKPAATIRTMLENKHGIDAVACYNDEIAFKVYETLRDFGVRVPEDVSVTGYDDSYFSSNCPVKLTTVNHPKDMLGEAAARLLLEMMKNPAMGREQTRKVIVPELVVKDSCAKK